MNELRNRQHIQEEEIQKLKDKVAEQEITISSLNTIRKDETQIKTVNGVSPNRKIGQSIKNERGVVDSPDMVQKKARILPETQIASAKSEQSGDLERNKG